MNGLAGKEAMNQAQPAPVGDMIAPCVSVTPVDPALLASWMTSANARTESVHMLPVIARTPSLGKSIATTELVPAANNICIDASRPPPTPAASPSGSSAPCAALGATIPNEAVVSVSSGRKLHGDI